MDYKTLSSHPNFRGNYSNMAGSYARKDLDAYESANSYSAFNYQNKINQGLSYNV